MLRPSFLLLAVRLRRQRPQALLGLLRVSMLRTRVRIGLMSSLVMSILFAALFTVVASAELFAVSAMPRYGEPVSVTMRVPFSSRVLRIGEGDLFDVNVEHRRTVIARGTVMDPSDKNHRAAVEYDASRRPPSVTRVGSMFVLYLIVCFVFSSYGRRFGHVRLRLLRVQAGIFGLMLFSLMMAKLILLFTALPAFWIALGPIGLWVTLGVDRRSGLLVNLILAFLVASLLRFDIMLLSVLATRGIIAALVFLNRKQPRQMILAGLASGLVAAVGFVALTMTFQGDWGAVVADFQLGLDSQLAAVVGGGLVGGMIANTLRELAELALGHVSRSRLLDLTDIEAPLLRKMATEAPGSWEHSRAMANLAEAAAAGIGADSLLTRVGAYYHDLGKTVQSSYFIENLAEGEPSPHDELAPEVSADAIMAHVVLGTRILREGGVPEPVVEFAYTHHGTQRVEYFWNKYKQQHPDEATREFGSEHFQYPGMKPMTKETGILMLVDAIEAASRTIQPPELDKFEEMIRRVIFHKLSSGQLDECGLDLRDLRLMTGRMAATLVNMYHGRIKYPWQRAKELDEQKRREAEEAADGDDEPEARAPEDYPQVEIQTDEASEPAAEHQPNETSAAQVEEENSP